MLPGHSYNIPVVRDVMVLFHFSLQSVANLIVYTYPVLVDTETVVILILCFILIVGAVVLLIVAFRQRYMWASS